MPGTISLKHAALFLLAASGRRYTAARVSLAGVMTIYHWSTESVDLIRDESACRDEATSHGIFFATKSDTIDVEYGVEIQVISQPPKPPIA